MQDAGPDSPAVTAVDPRVQRTRNDVRRVAIRVLIDEGWAAVTHQHVAQIAGYSKATLYTHWPTRTALVVDAFTLLRDVPHHTPTGDLRADLIAEVTTFRTAMVTHRLDRALAVLVDLTASVPELIPVRDRLVADGERNVRALLGTVLTGSELYAATLMLCGAVLQGALLHGHPPDDATVASAVDLTLRGIGGRRSLAS